MADKTTFVTNLYIGHHLLYCFAILEDYGGFCHQLLSACGTGKDFFKMEEITLALPKVTG